LMARSDIDAVMILEQSWLGWQPLLAACDAGKAVYWAGDFDLDPVENSDILSAVEESGIAFMTEFPRRFSPATLRLKELIATRLGAPRLIFCHRRLAADPCPPRNGAIHSDLSRRALIEAIDWCRYVVGRDPNTVTAMGQSDVDPPDYRCLSLHFESTDEVPAVTCQISFGRYIPPAWSEAVSFRPPSEMQVSCQRGVAFIDLPNTLVWFDDAGRHMESLESEAPVGQLLLGRFHRIVTSLVRKIDDLNDACFATSILAAADRSHREGRRIAISPAKALS